MQDMSVALVTVTYGDRIDTLEQVIRRSFQDPCLGKAIVVNNGSHSDLRKLNDLWGERVIIVDLEKNTGSANGYRVGIDKALEIGAEYILLLDDDNAPAKGAIGMLLTELEKIATRVGRENAAVQGLRGDGPFFDLATQCCFIPQPNSFLGFSLFDACQKILNRLLGGRATIVRLSQLPVKPKTLSIPYAQYGGLLAAREVFETLGVPYDNLILYADDWEYTLRLTRRGGEILLITGAEIEDLHPSLYSGVAGNRFSMLLHSGSDFRMFYETRNHVWLEKNHLAKSATIYFLNKWTYLAILFAYALIEGRRHRYSVLRKAVSDGESGVLGVNVKYQLL